MNSKIKSFLPHIGAYVLFLLISVIYFQPALEGNTLKMHDIQQHRGMSKEVADFRAETGEEALWTNSMFGGMPATQISLQTDSALLRKVNNVLSLGTPYPINILILYMIGFYILLMCLRVNPWLAIVGAIAFGLSTYFIVILEAGHRSKAYAIAYMPMVLGAVLYTFRSKKVLFGMALTAFFLAVQIAQNHIQITYYLFFVIVFVIVAEFIRLKKENDFPYFLKASGFLLVAALLSVSANISNLWGTYEYGKETIRGKNELTLNKKAEQAEGLDIAYITNWCLGKEETASILIPYAKGGKSGSVIQKAEDLDELEPNVKSTMMSIYQQGGYVNSYWGNQPGTTGGQHYVGAIVLFLAILCLVMIGDGLSWALFGVAILTIMLSWGHNFLGLTEFFVDHIPMYNKFRAVTIILVIPAMTFPLLMVLFLQKLFKNTDEIKANLKKLYITSGVFGGILLLFTAAPDAFLTFLSDAEQNIYTESSPIVDYRISVFKADALRSFGLIVLVFLKIIGYIKIKAWRSKRNQVIFILGFGFLIGLDLSLVDKRFLHNEKNELGEYVKWQPKAKLNKPFSATKGDVAIFEIEANENPNILKNVQSNIKLAQQEYMLETGNQLPSEERESIMFAELNKQTNYRVYATGNSFNESRTSYFHKSIGGYHGAKLRKYQDLIEYQISRGNIDVLNMLNMKYVLFPDGKGGFDLNGGANPQALGNAWFVQNIYYVDDANNEMKALGNIYQVDSEKELTLNGNSFKTGIVSDLDTLIVDGNPFDLSRLNLPLNQLNTIGSDSLSDIQLEQLKTQFRVTKTYDFNPRTTVVIRYPSKKKGEVESLAKDHEAFVQLTSYKPNHLEYEYVSSKDQYVVFSEIYYKKGWQAFIDGKPVDHQRVNYVLRGMQVPAGEHKIEFKYSLESYDVGKKVGYASSTLILLLLLALGFKEIKS